MVSDALDRILACDNFVRATRLTELVRFIVDEEQAGRGDRLKAFVIAQAVFGRDETFDAQNDTIVRVEMGRLRRRLEHYYLTAGAMDPLRIEIPRGAYVPVYKANEKPDEASAGSEQPRATTSPVSAHPEQAAPLVHEQKSRQLVPWVAGLAVAATLLVGWLINRTDLPAGAASDRPYVAVLPLLTLTSSPEELRIATGLIEAIITDLARMRSLSVMAHSSVLALDGEDVSLVSLRQDHGATHVLRGSLRHEPPAMRANLHLIDTATGRIVWAYSNEQFIDNAILQLESQMALQIAASMSATVNTDEEALINRGLSTSLLSLALYRQGLTVMNPPSDPARLESARFIFERLMAADPTFGGGPAGLAFTYATGVLVRSSQNPAADLQRAKQLARDAMAIDDGFAMGHATDGLAHAIAGDQEQALASAAAAVVRQPGDAMVQLTAGLVRSTLRQYREAIPYFEEALRLDPIEPRAPHMNLLGIAYIATGNPERGVALLERNVKRGGPDDPHLNVYRALGYAELGRTADARAALGAAQNGPRPVDPSLLLTGAFLSGEARDRALALLKPLSSTPPAQPPRVEQ